MVTDYSGMFQQGGITNPYAQYWQYGVEQPMQQQRTKALQNIYQQQAQQGTLRSGVGSYPTMELERGYQTTMGQQASGLALKQAQTQTQLEEAQRGRAFSEQTLKEQQQFQAQQAELQRQAQREMLERQYQMQQEILDQQKKYAEQQGWQQLVGGLAGMFLAPGISNLAGGLFGMSTAQKQNQQYMDWLTGGGQNTGQGGGYGTALNNIFQQTYGIPQDLNRYGVGNILGNPAVSGGQNYPTNPYLSNQPGQKWQIGGGIIYG